MIIESADNTLKIGDVEISTLGLEAGVDYFVHEVKKDGETEYIINTQRDGAIGGFRY